MVARRVNGIRLQDIDIEDFQRLDKSVPNLDLGEVLAEETAQKAPLSNAVAKSIPEMYETGILRAEVTGLQCIGFNHRLNEELHPSKSHSNAMPRSSRLRQRKRPIAVAESSDEEPPKKEAKISG